MQSHIECIKIFFARESFQITWPDSCKVTLVAFVRFFSSKTFQLWQKFTKGSDWLCWVSSRHENDRTLVSWKKQTLFVWYRLETEARDLITSCSISAQKLVEHSIGQSSDDDDEHDDDADGDCGGAGDDDDDTSRTFLYSELGQKYCSDTKNYRRAESRHPKSSKRTI